jgi:tetratricopeptide (TPR) repeat protein
MNRVARAALTLTLAALCAVAVAEKPSVAIYPFASQEVVLGVALAERVGAALESKFEVYGPAETPALVPPLVVQGGFISPLQLLSSDFGAVEVRDADSVSLLRETLGVDWALSGVVRMEGGELKLELLLASRERVQRLQVRSPAGEPGRLAHKVLAVLGARLGVDLLPADTEIDLASAYGDYVAALALLGGGFVSEATQRLDEALSQRDEPRWERVRRDLERTFEGELGENVALQAAASLSLAPFDEELSARYFERLEAERAFPAAATWLATLEVSRNDPEAAEAAFARAARYPYGQAARALYLAVQGEDARSELEQVLLSGQRGPLLAASLAAQLLNETELEKALLTQLTRLAPSLTYSFERLSFIAFDEDDPLAAAQALAVAVGLEEGSDLYWTNLGWAYYLLGFLERSEEASVRATQLNANQEVAWYNLGLVRAVTGRLDEAVPAYRRALALDPAVNEEAVEDLENALELFPGEAGVHYALGLLYEAQGRRSDAAGQFERFLEATRGEFPTFEAQAQERVRVLRAPPAPIAIDPGARLGLGPRSVEAAPYRPGDRLYPVFEVSTPGFALPGQLEIEVALEGEEAVRGARTVRVPDNAVGIRIDSVGVTLPPDLAPGEYALVIRVRADAERSTEASIPFRVEGEPSLLRQLVGRDVVMRVLETGAPFYLPRDVTTLSDERLLATLVEELRQTADAAEQALPVIEAGRFEGYSGGQLFRESSARDVADFLAFLLAQSDNHADFTFVDGYAQWALDGAPIGE